ncbi:MAG: GNAT family N-acetyltransferase [Armatimonadia bacterium]|nr:GNAT family N-acetyltransferase [Armatimonadia bacterium]
MPTDRDAEAIAIRPAEPDDIPAIIDIHLAAFPGLFLAQMGRGFLRQYYEAFVDHREGINRVAEADGRIAGFVVGTASEAAYRESVSRRKGAMVRAALARALTAPWLLPRIVGRMPSVRSETGDPVEREYLEGSAAHLVSIAVLPEASGGGIGAKLARAFEHAALEAGRSHVYLTTASEDNEAVHRFYRRLGYELVGTREDADGTAVSQYAQALDTGQEGPRPAGPE